MRRKSARTATKATSEKTKEKEEKAPKRRRATRRYKQSSSESESEEEVVTNQKLSQDSIDDKQEENSEPVHEVERDEEPTNVVTKSSNSKRTRNRSGNNIAEEDTASPEEKTIRRSRRRAASPKKEDVEEDLEDKRGKGKSKGKNKSKLDQTSQISENEMQSEISENVQVTAQSPQIDNVDINDADKVDDDGANQSIEVQTVPGGDASVDVRQEKDVRPRDDDRASSERADRAKSDDNESSQCVQESETPEDTSAQCSEGDESQKVKETAITTTNDVSEKVQDDEPNTDNKDVEHKETKLDYTANSLEADAGVEETPNVIVEETIEIEPKTTSDNAKVAVDTEVASEKIEEASLESAPTSNELNKSDEVSTTDQKVDEEESLKKESSLSEVVEESTAELSLEADEFESSKTDIVTSSEVMETSSTEVTGEADESVIGETVTEEPILEASETVNVKETSEEVVEEPTSEAHEKASFREDESKEALQEPTPEVVDKTESSEVNIKSEDVGKPTLVDPIEPDEEKNIEENKEIKQFEADKASEENSTTKITEDNLTDKCEAAKAAEDSLTTKYETTEETEEQKIQTEPSQNAFVEKSDNDEKTQEEHSPQPQRRKRSWGSNSLGLNSYSGLIEITMDIFKDMYPEITMLEETDVKLDANSSKEKHLSESAERRVSVTERHDVQESKNESKEAVDNIIAMNRKISIVDDDASKLRPPPSPAKNTKSDILFITNLVRPFTLKQLRELLERTGNIRADGFWTDRIKSKCYVHYETVEEAEATRNALHGVHWPICNGKKLNIDYATPECMEKARNPPPVEVAVPEKENQEPEAPLPKRVHKDSEESDAKHAKNDVHVWKIESAKEVQLVKRSRSKERMDKRRYSKSRLSRSPSKDISKKKQKKEDTVPQRAMDDLFRKTETTPCIYWQPLSPEEIALKQQQRLERMAEHKRRMENHSRSKRGTDHSRGGPYRRKY